MRSTSKMRVLIVSGIIVLLCMTIIVGMSFALFTDTKKVRNHLQAGDLEVTMTRTSLEYSVLDENGLLKVINVEDDLDFTNPSNENVFGVDSENIRIVPGTYFKADMLIKNDGNVAFDYEVGIKLIGSSNALADQLEVIVTNHNGVTTTKRLSEMINGVTVKTGNMLKGAEAQAFTVEVKFIDDTSVNNDAQTQIAEFDLVVNAVQATTP